MPPMQPATEPVRPTAGARRSPRSGRPVGPSPTGPLDQALDLAGEPGAVPARPTPLGALGLPSALDRALAARGITTAQPIQAAAIPDALAGRDILGRAVTGSGKTLAFGLPLLARVAGQRPTPGAPAGLVLAPTRELAEQIRGVLAPLGSSIGVTVALAVGGLAISGQIRAFDQPIGVLVATPGRLEDLLGRRACRLDAVQSVVLDEADHLADLGFLPAITRLLTATPERAQRLLFSATLDGAVSGLVDRFLREPAIHSIGDRTTRVTSMSHQVLEVQATEKLGVAAALLRRPGRSLVFVRTRHGVDRLVRQLARDGVDAVGLHGDLRQSARQRALQAFARGRPRVLVATDVAARGLDLAHLDLVVQYDPAADPKDYLHRSGRTARAGQPGTVVTLARPDERRALAALLHRAEVIAEVSSLDRVGAIVETLGGATRAPSHPVLHPSGPLPLDGEPTREPDDPSPSAPRFTRQTTRTRRRAAPSGRPSAPTGRPVTRRQTVRTTPASNGGSRDGGSREGTFRDGGSRQRTGGTPAGRAGAEHPPGARPRAADTSGEGPRGPGGRSGRPERSAPGNGSPDARARRRIPAARTSTLRGGAFPPRPPADPRPHLRRRLPRP
jgi:superfamily II DNA/RNA helicase